MKNKLKIVICVVMTCVFLLVPFSAFAYYDNPSPQMLYDIAKGTGKSIYTGYQVMCEDNNNYIFWSVDNSNISCRASTNSYPCNLSMVGGQAAAHYPTNVFKFPKSNIYDVTVESGNYGYYYDWDIEKIKNVDKILYSNKDINYKKGDDWLVFFPQMNSVPTATNRVQLNTVLSSIRLMGILDELIALLPILLPVLITFIAIRKGIAFCLATLRAV